MTGKKTYSGLASFPAISGEVNVLVGLASISLCSSGERFALDYSQIRSFELCNFRFLFETSDGPAEISQTGRGTDGFFEELWSAYAERTRESLFVEDPAIMEATGEYSYTDDGGTAGGEAKIRLYPTCVLILPRDNHARRVPLCFIEELSISRYTIYIRLDTTEQYELIRLGRDTLPFFDRLVKRRDDVKRQWHLAHQNLLEHLETRLGDQHYRFQALQRLCGKEQVICGIFAVGNDNFWMAGFYRDQVAVEIFTEEQTATYLYRIRGAAGDFVLRLRHAMEAMGLHREVLYLEDQEIRKNALYVMAVERNAHLRFLRSCVSGRVIHSETWEKKLTEIFVHEVT